MAQKNEAFSELERRPIDGALYVIAQVCRKKAHFVLRSNLLSLVHAVDGRRID